MFSMENCFYVLISQAMRCLKDPTVLPRDKQRVKQELSSELVSLRLSLYSKFLFTSFHTSHHTEVTDFPLREKYSWFCVLHILFLPLLVFPEHTVINIVQVFPPRLTFVPRQRTSAFPSDQTHNSWFKGHARGPGTIHTACPGFRTACPTLDPHAQMSRHHLHCRPFHSVLRKTHVFSSFFCFCAKA